jgi:hypothetical protein
MKQVCVPSFRSGAELLNRLFPCIFLLGGILLAGCAADRHVPPFAKQPYAPFSRADAIAIACREWRTFGSLVDDTAPEARPRRSPEAMEERQPGLWQRVGEYWWLGQDAGTPESRWTGKHDENGHEFPPSEDGNYAWSAAFISYVMRIAGAGKAFPYSPSHATYINAARIGGYALVAERPSAYAPRPGDLICTTRTRNKRPRFDDLPAGFFPSHCAIVVAAEPGTISIIGGNVDDAVVLTHVPVSETGLLTAADASLLDQRYNWFVVLRVLYEAEGSSIKSCVPPTNLSNGSRGFR